MIILKNAKEKKNTPHAECRAGGDVALPSWCACHHQHPHPRCPCPCFHLMGGRCCLVVRATPKSNSVDNVRALQGDATVLENAIKL